MDIATNNHWRPMLYWYELSDTERQEFDYLDSDACEFARFARYKSRVYDLGEFVHVDPTMQVHHPEFGAWQGYQSDSFFSGVLVRYSDDFEQCQLGTYIS